MSADQVAGRSALAAFNSASTSRNYHLVGTDLRRVVVIVIQTSELRVNRRQPTDHFTFVAIEVLGSNRALRNLSEVRASGGEDEECEHSRRRNLFIHESAPRMRHGDLLSTSADAGSGGNRYRGGRCPAAENVLLDHSPSTASTDPDCQPICRRELLSPNRGTA